MVFISENRQESDNEYFVIQTPLGDFRKKLRKSVSHSVPLIQLENSQGFCFKQDSDLFLNLNTKGETIGFDLKTNQIIMNHDSIEVPNFSRIALSEDDTVLIGITSDYKLHFYNFSCDI